MFALIVPTFNSEAYLARTLESLLRLDQPERIELIFSDDASTDGTVAVLSRWIGAHGGVFGRVELNVNQTNLGSSLNHGKAFSLARSEYGLYIGADDVIVDPGFPEAFETALEASGGVKIARTDVLAQDIVERKQWKVFANHGRFFSYSARRQFALFTLFGSVHQCGPGTVVHIPTLLNLPGAIDARYRRAEDVVIHLSFLVAGHAVRFLPVGGIVWVRSPDGSSYGEKARNHPQTLAERQLRQKEFIRPNLGLLTPWERLLLRLRQGSGRHRRWAQKLDPFGRAYRQPKTIESMPSETPAPPGRGSSSRPLPEPASSRT